MRSWGVADLRWASADDLALPAWRRSRDDAGRLDRWARGYLATRVPQDASPGLYATRRSMLSCEDPIAELRRLLDEARHRVSAVIEIGERRGLAHERVRELEALLGRTLPPVPPARLEGDGPVRSLGVTLDARDAPRTAAVLIPHWESLPFLRPCLRGLLAQRDPGVQQTIYVVDDASADGSYEQAREEFGAEPGIRFLRIERPNRTREADVGLLLDLALREVDEQYVATIDADVVPLAPEWLSLPIWLIERHACSAVGLDTGLSSAYVGWGRQRWWQPAEGYTPTGGLYDNDWFVCVNNLYRVMPTALAKVVSEQVGFSRSNPAQRWRRVVQRLGRGRRRYIAGGADNGVAANHFVDVNRLGPKFNIPLTNAAGGTPEHGAFGQNISGLLFHFALSTRALSRERREIDDAGDVFLSWAQRIQANDESALEEMIAASAELAEPQGPDDPIHWLYRERRFIDELVADFRASGDF